MAKIFATLPDHQVEELAELLDKVKPYQLEHSNTEKKSPPSSKVGKVGTIKDGAAQLESRLASFRSHQRTTPLPVDSVENLIPHDAAVTIVRGGTGSGKVSCLLVYDSYVAV
jgi:hypothetical protein